MAYDITEAFEDIELALIKSMRANMKRHIDDEYDEGMNWTQWQAEMLAGLSQYRAENQDVLKGYMGKMNSELDRAIRDAYATGESELEIELLKQIQKGYTPPKNGKKVNMQGAFFRNNQRKLNALVKATTDDMKKAETALLRMNDDIYRQTIFKAQMFYNTGAGSMWKCVDMATKDFLAAGYNCVEYKNGARVNISSYSEMALRTANKRANLMGQANFREKYGMHLVKVNARGTACPRCLPYLGQVYVDDVYGGGTAEESLQTGYPLLSTAVSGGLFHPNCKDACSTYYEGINQPPAEVTDEQAKEINRRYNLEQTQRYYERNYRKNVRLANGSLTEENVKKYSARASAYKKKLTDLCNANSDVLRLDKQRLSLHGVLSVDKNGRLSITPKQNKNATTGKIDGKKANVVQGKRLVGKVDYANSKFDHNIEAAMNAQGYDGKPAVVSRKEFEEAMKKSGFYAERTYSANSKEVLNAYQNELYNGKWYVDCSTGGAQYGQGMYCAAAYDEMNHKYDYTNKDSLRGIAEEMKHYKELNADRGNKLSKTESITLQSDAKIYTLRSGMPRDITERYVNEYCKERVTDEKARKAVDRLIEIDEMEQRREKMNYNAIAWEKRQLKADIPSEIRDEAWGYVKDKDPGVLAVEMGYDAINAMGHGESRSYTVILNRTKVIFCEGGSIHGN